MEAFWTMWEAWQESLLRLGLHWMGGHRADAEDALSQAKLQAALSFRSRPGRIDNPGAWLRRILHNVCMDLHRARRDRRTVAVDLEAPPRPILPPPSSTPEREVMDRESLRRLGEEILTLPAPLRDALLDRCLGGASYSEIARRASTTEVNIRKRVQLARKRLRHQMG